MCPRPSAIGTRVIGTSEPVLERYERVTFEKELIAPQGLPLAAFICPGHPLLDATLDITLERNRELLRRGTVLVDDRDAGTEPRVLFYAEHAVQDASLLPSGERRTVSKRMLYVELDAEGNARHMQYAPYLDYRPLRDDEPDVDAFLARSECAWITRELEQRAMSHAIAEVAPQHIAEVRDRRLGWIEKTRAAVKERLAKEISYWDNQAARLREQETAGKTNARLNAQEARRRADDLQGRLQRRLAELDREAQTSALPPVILGGVMVVPAGLIAAMTGRPLPATAASPDRQAVAAEARRIVMEAERRLGFDPVDREFERLGYDVESRDPQGAQGLRFIEVKGRAAGADTVTVTKNEILFSLNKPDAFILALVEFSDGGAPPRALLAPPLPWCAGLRGEQRELRFRRVAGALGATVVTDEMPRVVSKKKLIEVALPLDAINKASKREKSIRHGHPSTLHLWWARRPLAAARAVIFAQMVDDPSANPNLFPTERAQEKERQRLFRIIEQLVLWESTTSEAVLEQAREEIWQSWRRACAENADHPRAKELFDRHVLPAFHDPFAGGGSLPLEAQRLGLEAHASDLNPVAVLINKAMIEIPPKFAGKPPVNPEAQSEKRLMDQTWRGAQGLAEDVRYYGGWMRDEAEKRIGDLRLTERGFLSGGSVEGVEARRSPPQGTSSVQPLSGPHPVPGSPSRADVGFQAVADETVEGHETAHKGAVTDALKRALRSYGDQFGTASTATARRATSPPRCAARSSTSAPAGASPRRRCGPPCASARAVTSTSCQWPP